MPYHGLVFIYITGQGQTPLSYMFVVFIEAPEDNRGEITVKYIIKAKEIFIDLSSVNAVTA
jgi:hypothetical protein